MPDSIATFPLRDASNDQLSVAMGRSLGEFQAWHGQALFVLQFAQYARSAGVDAVITGQITQSLDLARQAGYLIKTARYKGDDSELIEYATTQQLALADHGAKIAAIVMLHNGYERLLWRLIRFGLVTSREKVLKERIARKTVTVGELLRRDADSVIDEQMEKWWESLERASLANKWDILADLVGYPAKLNDPPNWYFDREMLIVFDDVRINAVHHDGREVAAFELSAFANQLSRAQWIWLVQIAELLQLRIPPETLFHWAETPETC